MASEQMKALCDIMRKMLGQGSGPMFGGKIDPIALRETVERAQRGMPTEPGVTCTEIDLGGIEGEVCMPEGADTSAAILYIHGGGLICGNAFTSRGYASMLAAECKMPVYTLSYRLAPEHPYPAAVEDCYVAYAALLEMLPGTPIVLIGESGGGHLSLTTVIKARTDGAQLPAAVIPYSPVVDMSGCVDRSANDGKDFTVTEAGLEQLKQMYCAGEDAGNPLISPILADYTGFPPMLLAWDDSETLAADSEVLAEKARAAGVAVQAKSYPDCFHAFAISARGTPEGTEVLADTVAFIHASTSKY